MFGRRVARTNSAFLLVWAAMLLIACTTRDSTVKTNPDSAGSTLVPGVLVPPVVSAVAFSSASPQEPVPMASAEPPADEALILEYQDLGRGRTSKADLEAFVAAHPHLLTAYAPPYGPTIKWVLEYEEEEGALVLLAAGATTTQGTLALAARGGLDKFVSAMLAKGVSPDEADHWGFTPLHAAAKYGHASTIRKLLAAKANPNVHQVNDGFTPLHLALMERKEEAIAVLLAAHADTEVRDTQGRTPLHWGPFAYLKQEVHIYFDQGSPHDTQYLDVGPPRGMKLLLDAGAKIDAVDDEGNTPLHEAAYIGSVRGAEILIARGAKVNVKNKGGETPLSIANGAPHRRGVLKLLQKGP